MVPSKSILLQKRHYSNNQYGLSQGVIMRILFTGGAGKAGKHSINYLLEQGHSILNLDKVHL